MVESISNSQDKDYLIRLISNKGANIQNCSTSGILGSIAGFFGSLQATEIIKEILNIGESLAGHLNIYDLLNNNFRKIKVNKDPKCNFCSNPLK